MNKAKRKYLMKVGFFKEAVTVETVPVKDIEDKNEVFLTQEIPKSVQEIEEPVQETVKEIVPEVKIQKAVKVANVSLQSVKSKKVKK